MKQIVKIFSLCALLIAPTVIGMIQTEQVAPIGHSKFLKVSRATNCICNKRFALATLTSIAAGTIAYIFVTRHTAIYTTIAAAIPMVIGIAIQKKIATKKRPASDVIIVTSSTSLPPVKQVSPPAALAQELVLDQAIQDKLKVPTIDPNAEPDWEKYSYKKTNELKDLLERLNSGYRYTEFTLQHIDLIRQLIIDGAVISNFRHMNMPLLSIIIKKSSPLLVTHKDRIIALIEYLLDKGANIEEIDSDGMTALWHAVDVDSIDLINVLLRHSAKLDVEKKDFHNFTIFDHTRNNNIKELLLDEAAKQIVK